MSAVNPVPTTEIERLLTRPSAEQEALGYVHTLREIVQQPATWVDTAAQVSKAIESHQLASAFDPALRGIVLTGSGSSHYIGESLALGLQAALHTPVQAVPAGTLLTHWHSAIPNDALLVSFARSGDSPESAGVVDALLAQAPDCRHLFITCNANGHLATHYRNEPRVTVLLLDERTNDRSLVMTSSFTNLMLAGRGLAARSAPHAYRQRAGLAADLATRVLAEYTDPLAVIARRDFHNIAFLGSGVRFGAARESALKMLEMSGGQVQTLAETFLGLRHGPMSALDARSLVVAFVSADPAVRAYECDLLRELARKGLGTHKVLVGADLPADMINDVDVVVDLPGLAALGDEDAPLIDAVVGQLLAFFRCLQLGFKPDAPSQGVLTRVVQGFALHGGAA
ncbi:SIS domain-containing protein [Lysobacter sp. CFH 32150]|uniref:SIS domain-containing protein n=1 Tax=Lysobacter sp. CFH 32150 TaxID=2927128 RepID=UPI001FA7719A|nr:SIS domain-containing protein [Lysobacter sp. CFH 32150]MCI4568365.1 SIS domain-containing protein [Lysobacter sp. CFH 32150]